MILAMKIAIFILVLVVVTVVSSKIKYFKKANHFCPNDFKNGTQYTSWRKAKAACDRKENCVGFYNACKFKNEFYLCDIPKWNLTNCGSTLFEAGIYIRRYLYMYIIDIL